MKCLGPSAIIRSKAIRDSINVFISDYKSLSGEKGKRAGTITFVYEHERPKISDLLTDIQHRFSDLIDATLHIHLNETRCLEVLAVRGESQDIRRLAEALMSLGGVETLKATLI
jgi:CopG family nickel-responsive transcriptional regulator